MEKAKMSEENQKMRYKFEKKGKKLPNMSKFGAPGPKNLGYRRDGEPPLSTP